MTHDVLIVGGGPAGLSAALALGRARKQVLLCDAGPRRNAKAEHLYNFVTQDGVTPQAFRDTARAQLARYPNVQIRDVGVQSIGGARGAFEVALGDEIVTVRRILLAVGMVDEALPIEGFAERWGHSVFQCPYCHGWENQDRPWGFVPRPEEPAHLLPFSLMIRGWTDRVTVFTRGLIELPAETRQRLLAAGISVEDRPLRRLVGEGSSLAAVETDDGAQLPCEALFAHPPQRHVPLVAGLGLALDEAGFVKADPMRKETSIPGIYAAGDLTTRGQGAMFGASAGTQAAGAINVDLAMDR